MSDRFPLIWMADVLRAAGCKVVEEPGWKTRGRPRAFAPRAIMLHHDASPVGATSGGVNVIRDGRPGLSGPLGNLWLAFDGTWHCVAAGSANHSGVGGPWGVIGRDAGNHDALGIESDHTTDEMWSADQRSEGLLGVWALAQRMGIDTPAKIARAVCSHREYAPNRKVDPHPLNMTTARANLARFAPSATGTPPAQGQQEGFVDYETRVSDQPQTFTPYTWLNVRMAEPDDPSGGSQFGIVTGPKHFVLDLVLTTAGGIEPGRSVMVRATNTEGDATNVVASHPIEQFGATDGGTQHFAYRAQGWVGEGQWLRAQLHTDQELTVTRSETRCTTW